MYKVKRFSRIGRGLKGAIGGAAYGAWGGGAISAVPALVVGAFSGKAGKATLITGAGLGAGVGAYYGYKNAVGQYDYEKILENPELKSQEKEKNKPKVMKFIKEQSMPRMESASKVTSEFLKIESEYDVQFKPDLYNYIKFYESFQRRYCKEWAEVWSELIRKEDFDIEFSYIFPMPNYEMARDNIENTDINSDTSIVIAGDIENSDHSLLFYDFDRLEYEFSLGSGYGANSLSNVLTRFVSSWKMDLGEIKYDELRNVAEVHNKIIDEFLRGIKSI